MIYTAYGWSQPITAAAEHVEPYFEGSYWTGTAPPISTTVFPSNAVLDMESGDLLAGPGDIADVEDFLPYVEQAGAG